jgi:hypothetical protein
MTELQVSEASPLGGRPRLMQERVTYSANVEREQVDAIRGLSRRLGVSQSELVREALGLLMASRGVPGS